MGRFSNKMWKVLGAQSTRNQSRSVAQIEQSAAFDEWAQGLSDDEFPDAALALDVYAAKSDDRAKFIAIAREGADRALGLRPFDVVRVLGDEDRERGALGRREEHGARRCPRGHDDSSWYSARAISPARTATLDSSVVPSPWPGRSAPCT